MLVPFWHYKENASKHDVCINYHYLAYVLVVCMSYYRNTSLFLLMDLFSPFMFICGKRALSIFMRNKLPSLPLSNLYWYLSTFWLLFCFQLCGYYWSDTTKIECVCFWSVKFLCWYLIVLIILECVVNCSASFGYPLAPVCFCSSISIQNGLVSCILDSPCYCLGTCRIHVCFCSIYS